DHDRSGRPGGRNGGRRADRPLAHRPAGNVCRLVAGSAAVPGVMARLDAPGANDAPVRIGRTGPIRGARPDLGHAIASRGLDVAVRGRTRVRGVLARTRPVRRGGHGTYSTRLSAHLPDGDT